LNLDMDGGVAVITGAASGIGAALAESLAKRGMHAALVDRDTDGLEATAQRVRAHGLQATTHAVDVTDRAALAGLPHAVVQAPGRATVLVNNAGVALGGSFLQVQEDDFDWLMAINFEAVVRLTRGFLPILSRERAAQVVNVSSIFGIVAPPGQTAYCASKFAVRGFSESLRHELEMASSPVGVTLVHPGGVRTSIAQSAKPPQDVTPAQEAEYKRLWQAVLRMPAQEAGEIIARGIERREKRILVGKDARQAAFLQRLFPVGYWKLMAREIGRQVRRQGAAR
jgi:short-subunit dehydrogenase